MDQPIAKRDDPVNVADFLFELREPANALAGGFADDEELPFNSAAQEII
ncbi:MAG: hypothetical protein JJ992_27510 [Planctomycetes bacterium]|nr:hypothetical protein [Planctomycetota bacterium]